jgi:peptidyl-prolyl cis-trans isomerase C
VLARVDGQEMRASDVLDAAADLLPEEIRAVPPAAVLAMLPPDMLRQLTDRAVTERAFLNAARKAGLDRDPEVARRVRRAEEQELQQALLTRELAALVTDAAVRARFERDNAGRAGEEEVHARHILLRTETEAKQVLAELQRPGADFAAIARQRSVDPGAQNGGDLGFFKKSDMVPEFANAAFALQPGQTATAPVRSPFGWHIIRVEARRTAPPPDFDAVKDTLRRQMMEEQVATVVNKVRDQASIERLDQAPPARSLMDNAAPPPPPAGPAPTAPPARR